MTPRTPCIICLSCGELLTDEEVLEVTAEDGQILEIICAKCGADICGGK